MTTKTKPDTTPAAPKVEVIPAGSREVLWVLAAAWAGVTVQELLADTAPVKAAHYEAASRVEVALDEWDLAQGFEDDSAPAESKVLLVENHLSIAADALMTAAPSANQPEVSGRYAAAAADIYAMMHNLRSLPKVKVAK